MNKWHLFYIEEYESCRHEIFNDKDLLEKAVSNINWDEPGKWFISIVQGKEFGLRPYQKVLSYEVEEKKDVV